MRILVTGATGFVGGHLVEACQRRGWHVTALARPTSDTKALEAAGVAIVRCEPTDAVALRGAIAEIDVVVNCLGAWARQFAEKHGVAIPLQAAEHYYLLTEPIAGVSRSWPVIEDPSSHGYFREEGGRP